MKPTYRIPLTALLLACVFPLSCRHDEYDVTRGIDREITLFNDEVSLPLADVGPFSPKLLLEQAGLYDFLKDYVSEDEDGYLVVENSGDIYSDLVFAIYIGLPDPAAASSVSIKDFTDELDSSGGLMEAIGFSLTPQSFTLLASNPLTQDVTVSGKLTLNSPDDGENPVQAIYNKEFTNVKVPASATNAEILSVQDNGDLAMYDCLVENLSLNLPPSLLTLDPQNGLGTFGLSYRYKSFLCMKQDLGSLPLNITDLNLELAQYNVKEVKICADVSNEIPLDLELESARILVKVILDNGKEGTEVYEDVSITPDIKIAGGSTGNPSISPIELLIKANEGTIPDIAGLELELSVLAPKSAADKRLGMNQNLYFNNLRAKISGGITIQGL